MLLFLVMVFVGWVLGDGIHLRRREQHWHEGGLSLREAEHNLLTTISSISSSTTATAFAFLARQAHIEPWVWQARGRIGV